MAVCKGSRRKIGEIFISSCHLPVAAECDIVIVSEPSPNPIGSSWAVLLTQLIPARGRKQLLSGPEIPAELDTTYPREGTETLKNGYIRPGRQDTTYPREGTETHYRGRHADHHRDTTYPREGTETRVQNHWNLANIDTTYPREGTETTAELLADSDTNRHNLSPRGDGNLCPRRRRRTAQDTTYPREGTETLRPDGLYQRWLWTQLIPARGRKPTN